MKGGGVCVQFFFFLNDCLVFIWQVWSKYEKKKNVFSCSFSLQGELSNMKRKHNIKTLFAPQTRLIISKSVPEQQVFLTVDTEWESSFTSFAFIVFYQI